MAIIRSILDTDLYKFTTSYAYSKLFPRAFGEFEFVDRNNLHFPAGFDKLVRRELESMADLFLTKEEELFLKNKLPYLPPTYIDFLKGYRFDPAEVEVEMTDGKLSIRSSGLLYRITFWETPILAIVSELYFREMGVTPDVEYMERRLIEKATLMREHGIVFSLFGMRRRFSFGVEDRITELLKLHSGSNFFGTSNVYLAYKHNLNPSGTHPHEWVQFHGSIYGYKMANYMAMENWINVYDGDLGTVLTDTFTTDVFLRNFSKKHAALFTSLRQDSGDPFAFTDKAIRRYEELRINPKLKYIVFSDSLDVEKALKIKNYCGDKIGASFGIGTNLTNDVGNENVPLNIVMKLFRCKMTEKESWQHCIKLSDVDGKHTGSPDEIKLALQTLGI
ncbi:MAG: nicotinate phosphoribosyltransferase [Prevotella sp.]|jgi:nicotinate phosphoribosyltransferase|uniref:Nicotinate phosphoribosyltransferase n=1 Tax=Parabacteroides chartae TaxID=1037355 RepID=A0A1T5F4D8_9BACT|nr:nicotinate phosphoribosyltransferase [Parabacteroides chartae]OCW92657.1 nicotinate phosphoribosyltransferase [Macellibacteroides sp. HH-ZS]SKB90996.1 nicotinate phosphoribosyltransferase [Parabacteroides chartae]